MVRTGANTGLTIQSATASSNTPKQRLTPSIQTPARGSSVPAPTPTMTRGTPKPSAIANKAAAPNAMLPVWAINASTPNSGAVMQAPTTSAEIAPIRNTAASLPPERCCDNAWTRPCQACGICNS